MATHQSMVLKNSKSIIVIIMIWFINIVIEWSRQLHLTCFINYNCGAKEQLQQAIELPKQDYFNRLDLYPSIILIGSKDNNNSNNKNNNGE